MRVVLKTVAATTAAVTLLGLAACGGGADGADDGASGPGSGTPTVFATTSILGDVIAANLAPGVQGEVLMPPGVDPHDFSLSTRDAERMGEADLLVINGAGLEAHLADAIDRAEANGVEVFDVSEHVDLLGDDPHLWTDPSRMVAAVEALGAEHPDLFAADRITEYVADLEQVDADIEAQLADLPADRRVLVTNHEVLGYFADRYDFEVVGAVIPSPTTGAEASAASIDELADVVTERGVPAIFAETSSSDDLARALADSTGTDVQVVDLFTESLGEPGSGADTYLGLLRTDAQRIHDALAA